MPNILICRDRRMLVVVEGWKPHCCLCGASWHMAKACPWKNVTTTSTATAKATVAAEIDKTPNGVRKEVVSKGQKFASDPPPPTPQQDTPSKEQKPLQKEPEEQQEEWIKQQEPVHHKEKAKLQEKQQNENTNGPSCVTCLSQPLSMENRWKTQTISPTLRGVIYCIMNMGKYLKV